MSWLEEQVKCAQNQTDNKMFFCFPCCVLNISFSFVEDLEAFPITQKILQSNEQEALASIFGDEYAHLPHF
jgi:hypothetical protein